MKRIRVLLVVNDEETRNFLCGLLTKYNCNFDIAPDLPTAFVSFDYIYYDFVITDDNDTLDGVKLILRAAEKGRCKNAFFLICTDKPWSSGYNQVINDGGYVKKSKRDLVDNAIARTINKLRYSETDTIKDNDVKGLGHVCCGQCQNCSC